MNDERHGDQRGERGPPREEQQEQGHHEQDPADDGRPDEVALGLVGVGRRPEDRRRPCAGPRGRAGARRAPRSRPSARPRCWRTGSLSTTTRNESGEALVPGEDRVADERLVVLDHGGDVTERQRRSTSSMVIWARSSGLMMGRLCWMPRRCVGVSMKPPVPGRRRLEEGQRRHPQGVARRADDLLQRDVLVPQLGRIDLDLQLALPLTPDGHVRRRPARPGGGAGSSSGRARRSAAASASSTTARSSTSVPSMIAAATSAGGRETCGRPAAWLMRSCTTWRAR